MNHPLNKHVNQTEQAGGGIYAFVWKNKIIFKKNNHPVMCVDILMVGGISLT